MDKIKDKNTWGYFFGLRDKLFAEPLERAHLYLGIAKNFFIFSAFVYFFMLLMTIGGSFVAFSSAATFFFFPIFAFSTFVFLYNICSYNIIIYLGRYLFLRYVALGICGILFLSVLSFHLGFHTFLLSVLGIK